MRFLGHILRLPENTPVRKALAEHLRPVKRDPGRPQTTWWSLVIKDLKLIGLSSTPLSHLLEVASDRDKWRSLVINNQ